MEKKGGLFDSFTQTIGFVKDFWNENVVKPINKGLDTMSKGYNQALISMDSEKNKPYFELAEIKLQKTKLNNILKNLKCEFEEFAVEFNEVHKTKMQKIFVDIQSKFGSEKFKIVSILFKKSKDKINVYLLSAIEILSQTEMNYVGQVLYIDKERYEIHRKASLDNSPNFLEELDLKKFTNEEHYVIDMDNTQLE